MGCNINTQDTELMDLLKRLHASFGIGVIDLRTDEDKSAILLNAKYKEKIDYTVASELSAKNEKFNGFLKSDYDPTTNTAIKMNLMRLKRKRSYILTHRFLFKKRDFKKRFKRFCKK